MIPVGVVLYCRVCSYQKYGIMENRTDNIVTIAVFRHTPSGPEALIVKRGSGMAQGQWGLPTGHVNYQEPPYQAAVRELEEETSIRAPRLGFISSGASTHGPSDILYGVEVPVNIQVRPRSDAAAAVWMPLNKLPGLAFNHQQLAFLAYAKMFGSHTAVEDFLGGRMGANVISEDQNSGNGTLIVFEGTDGSGKSTQCAKLADWLDGKGYAVVRTKWNSSPLLSQVIDSAKKERVLTPLLYSLLHVADMMHRYHAVIEPALAQNKIVVSDRYFYTSMVRDDVRKVDPQILELVYRDFRRPDIIFYVDVPPEETFRRLKNDKDVGYYSSGMDMGYSTDRWESLQTYLREMHNRYQKVLSFQQGYCHIDGTKTIKEVFKTIKKHLVSMCCLGTMDEHLTPNEIGDVIADDLGSHNGLIF
jgi:dTMP kinase